LVQADGAFRSAEGTVLLFLQSSLPFHSTRFSSLLIFCQSAFLLAAQQAICLPDIRQVPALFPVLLFARCFPSGSFLIKFLSGLPLFILFFSFSERLPAPSLIGVPAVPLIGRRPLVLDAGFPTTVFFFSFTASFSSPSSDWLEILP